MQPDEETLGTLLAKMDGKIDLLSQKLDAHKDLLMAEMRAGDREAGQAIALTNERVTNLAGQVADNRNRLAALEKANSDQALIIDSFSPVKKVVYGLVGLCLVALMSGVLALVLRGSP